MLIEGQMHLLNRKTVSSRIELPWTLLAAATIQSVRMAELKHPDNHPSYPSTGVEAALFSSDSEAKNEATKPNDKCC